MRSHFPVTITAFVLLLSVSIANASEDERVPLSVQLSTGRQLRAMLDPRTNTDRLWLRFGTARTSVLRGFDWQDVARVHQGEQPLTQRDILDIVATTPPSPRPESTRRIVISPSDRAAQPPGQPAESVPTGAGRVASITFDAVLGNWDADVASDGLRVQVQPVDFTGEPVAVRGVLTVELYSMHRAAQNSLTHGRGRDFRLVGTWTTSVDCTVHQPGSGWVQLPYQASHPELDVDWAPYGIVHLRFVVPGHGVFHHSIDGVRIRPFAPLRDVREAQSGLRFLSTELN